MIIKGTSRGGPAELGDYLVHSEKNERTEVVEVRGTVDQHPRGALIEMEAWAAGTRCDKPLYHAMISPQPPHRLTPDQRLEAVDVLEKNLKLDGHARVIVIHEHEGREHIHVVWARIDLQSMKAVSDGHNFLRHELASRALERRFGHDRIQGAHAERDGVKRPDRTPSRSELRQEERTGLSGKIVKAEVSAAYRRSDSPDAFRAALHEKSYVIARGDRRDFVVVDRRGGIHSLARRLDGVNAATLRAFMAPVDISTIPSIEVAQEQQVRRRQLEESHSEALLERSFGHGEDYVSQSRAAQNEFERHQKKLDYSNKKLRPEEPQEREERQRLELERRDKGKGSEGQVVERDEPAFRDIEMTDAMQERIDRMLSSSAGPTVRDPDRQNQAPGGGRTRSR